MPYELKGKCVKNKKTGKNMGCSKTEKMAKAHIKALYAAEDNKLNEAKLTRSELKDKITTIAQKLLSDRLPKKDDVLQTQDVEIETDKFPLLTQFPSLKTAVIKLLTKQYKDFIKDIWWVAPRPTTFKIILENEQYFYLIYGERSWTAKVSGKKYYINNINEEQRAAQAISDLLMYGPSAAKEEVSGEVPTGGETPADETSFATPPAGETPPTEEPTSTEEVPEEVPV